MRFMILVKATRDSEAGVMPSEQLLAEMGKFNEELVKAGVMQAGEGLHPSSKGARVRFSGKNRSVVDGPFAETKELVAGFWIWQCASMQEAIDWVKRCPNPMPGESEIEIRQVFEAERLRRGVHAGVARAGRAAARAGGGAGQGRLSACVRPRGWRVGVSSEPMNLQLARRNPSTMNATASAQAAIARAMRQPPAPRPEPESASRDPSLPGVSPRLPVWEERARKMGFPPSPR